MKRSQSILKGKKKKKKKKEKLIPRGANSFFKGGILLRSGVGRVCVCVVCVCVSGEGGGGGTKQFQQPFLKAYVASEPQRPSNLCRYLSNI